MYAIRIRKREDMFDFDFCFVTQYSPDPGFPSPVSREPRASHKAHMHCKYHTVRGHVFPTYFTR